MQYKKQDVATPFIVSIFFINELEYLAERAKVKLR